MSHNNFSALERIYSTCQCDLQTMCVLFSIWVSIAIGKCSASFVACRKRFLLMILTLTEPYCYVPLLFFLGGCVSLYCVWCGKENTMNPWFCLLLAGTTTLPTLVRTPTLMMQPSLDIKPFMSFPVDSSSSVGFFPNFNTVSKGVSTFSFSVCLPSQF